MIFKLNNGSLCDTKSDYSFNDLQIEKLVVGGEFVHELNYNVFGDAFLYLGRQVSNKKNCETFYAVDTFGRGVVIDFDKADGKFATNCINTINLIAAKNGEEFVNYCLGRKATEEETYTIKQFVKCEYTEINKDSRVVTFGRSFDPAYFNFANWMSENKFAFKAIRYFSTKNNGETLIEFSKEYETYSKYSYALKDLKNFKNPNQETRKPNVYFHDIGHADEKWWNFLQNANVVTASYNNVESPACRGYTLINQYVPGDVVIAYANGYGVVGFGTVTSKGYAFKDHDMTEFSHTHFHTMSVQWEATLPFSMAITMKTVKDKGLNWPVKFKQEIRYNKGIIDSLLNDIKTFCQKKKAA